MNAHMTPNHLPEPPPVPRNDFQLDVLDGDRVVGWITPAAIGFAGFATETEAAHAAWVAYRALARRLARRDGRRPVPIDTEPLRLVSNTDGRIIYGSRDRIARLIEPTEQDAAHAFGFELRLDGPLDAVSVRAKALLIYRTLRRSGMRWSMWAPASAPTTAARAIVPATAPLRDAEMIVEDPLELRDLVIGVVLLTVAAFAVIAPGAIGVIAALAGIAGLMVLRVTMLHAGWPRRGRHGTSPMTKPAFTNGGGGSHAARAT
jgi:hypothetical protein